MTHEEYSEIKALNATAIKAGAKSMLHMHAALHGPGRKDTDAMRFGRLVHAEVAERGSTAALPVWHGSQRRGKDWEAFKAELFTRDYINGDDEAAELQAIAAALDRRSDVTEILGTGWATERVIRWHDSALGPCKARLDGIRVAGVPAVLEFKTMRDIDVRAFGAQFSKLYYDIQLGWYRESASRELSCSIDEVRVYLLALETEAPYDIVLYSVPSMVLDEGYQRAREIATRYRECEARNEFPGVAPGLAELVLPPWHGNHDAPELDMSGLESEAE